MAYTRLWHPPRMTTSRRRSCLATFAALGLLAWAVVWFGDDALRLLESDEPSIWVRHDEHYHVVFAP